MRHGLRRSLSALVSGTAFAVSVAGPVQWDPCPEHGASLSGHAAHVQMAGSGMQMAAPERDAPAAASHSTHRTPDSHHAGHQCTCPGGCCSTSPVGLRAPMLRAPLATHVVESARIELPAATIAAVPSAQIALPFAHAPPRFEVTPQHAAHIET